MFLLGSWQVSAAVFETAEDCELGEVYEGSISYSERVRAFRFILSEDSRITLNLKCNRGRCSGAIYHASGKEVLKREDLEFETNFFTGQSVAQLSRILPAGAYYMEIQNEGKWKWQTCRFSFWIQAQKKVENGKRNVCPYTVYDDGGYVFGENSYVKAIVTKK